jgi:hypothetical protein
VTKFDYDRQVYTFPQARFTAVVNNELYFAVIEDLPNYKRYALYKWNGNDTPSKVMDINKGYYGQFLSENNKLYFFSFPETKDSVSFNAYDPISNSTTCVFKQVGVYGDFSINAFNGKLYFTTNFPKTGTLYEYDPATGSTITVPTKSPIRLCTNIKNINSKMYFLANATTAHLTEIWVYDGVNPAEQVTFFGDFLTSSADMVYMDDKIYFQRRQSNLNSTEIWTYSTTTKQVNCQNSITKQLADSTGISLHLAHNGKLYFAAGQFYPQLYTFDGNTVRQVGNNLTFSNYYDNFIMNGDIGYFNGGNLNDSINALVHFADWGTKVDDVIKADDVSLYPNPTNSTATLEINLKSQKQLSLTITDAMGRVAAQYQPTLYHAGKNKLQVNMESFAPGVYYCRLADDAGAAIWSGKLLKE